MAEKGFKIENKPNAKITLEQYKILAKVFADASMDKEETAELFIGKTYSKEKGSEKVVTQEKILPEPIEPAPIAELKAVQETIEEQVAQQEVQVVAAELPELPVSSVPESITEQPIVILEPVQPIDIEEPIIKEEVVLKPSLTVAAPEKVFMEETKLKGLTILGKMDLTEKEGKKFQQVASSDKGQESKKRPRKRIAKKPVPVVKEPSKAISKVTPSKVTPGKVTPSKVTSKVVKQEKAALSEKAIQEQIKNTLAKLGGASKTTNRAKYRKEKRSAIAEEREGELLQAQQEAKKLQVTEFISANDLASLMGVTINEVLSTCMSLGMIISINQRLDAEAIAIIADEFGYQVEFTTVEEQVSQEEVEEDLSQLTERAPIVTVMGHVDHGKTSLLDCIRNTQITKGEAGGITQHIGAYSVMTERGKRIAFLDTPGHEAFTAMRARGAKLTDLAIIVVAADDGVRPQTKEAINHAQLAGVPIIIAINKIDKPDANPEKVKEELANLNILVEDWGGKYQSQAVSAKTGQGVNELLDKVLLEAEMLELKANIHKQARGTVIEAALDQGRGYMATIMIQNGTLHVGEIVLAGAYYGKVKAMFDYLGKGIKEASPSTPVQMLGLNGAPQAGDLFRVMSSEKEAREMATQRQQILREQGLRTKTHITLDEIGRRLAIGNFKELNIILKGDVDGSVEALSDSLLKLSTEEIKVNILHKGVGAIVESDILLAAASDAIVIGFQVRPSSNVRKLAEKEGIEIRLY